MFPEYPVQLLLLFRVSDDLYVPHALCDYREQFYGSDCRRLSHRMKLSPYFKYFSFLEHVGTAFKRNDLPIVLNFNLNFPPRITVSDVNFEQADFAKRIVNVLELLLDCNYRFYNGGSLLTDICPTLIESASTNLLAEMQQLTNDYFLFEFPALGRPADLSI